MKKKNILLLLTALVASGCIITGASAYFTDYRDADISAELADLRISVTDLSELDGDGDGLLTPGEKGCLRFNVENRGTVSADIKAVITLSSSAGLSGENPELRLEAGGANEQGVTDFDPGEACYEETEKTVRYEAVLGTLNGSAQQEEGTEADSGIYNAGFEFIRSASNRFMGSDISVHYVIYAKQHRNTTDSDWEVLTDCEAAES